MCVYIYIYIYTYIIHTCVIITLCAEGLARISAVMPRQGIRATCIIIIIITVMIIIILVMIIDIITIICISNYCPRRPGRGSGRPTRAI